MTEPTTVEKWKTYRKTTTITAVQWTGDNYGELVRFSEGCHERCRIINQQDGLLSVAALEGVEQAREGSWLAKGIRGELYLIEPWIFRKTYEEGPQDDP